MISGAKEKMRENYYEAGIRHFLDGCVLLQEECYDNAVGLFGNSAECALKNLIEVFCGERSREILQFKYGHAGKNRMNDLYSFIVNSSVTSLLDPALGLKLHSFELPDVLFQGHPERRYAGNGQFLPEDVNACKDAVDFLIKEIITQHIDGYI